MITPFLAILIIPKIYSLAPSYDCKPGQGERGKTIKKIKKCFLLDCEEECKANAECIGYDFSENCDHDSCRLYASNNPREDLGSDNRQYCTKG